MIVWHSDPSAPLAPLPRWVAVAGWLVYAVGLAWGVMSRGLLVLVAALVLGQARDASAGLGKPIGLFGAMDDAPAWADVLTLSDLAGDPDWRLAADLSRTRGIVWWLQVGYHEDPRTPIEAHAARVRARLDAFGLLPYIAGQSLGEEWYELAEFGAFEAYGLARGNPDGWRIIRDWLGRQHAALKRAIPVPVVWITTAAGHPSGTLRPVPEHVDAVGLDVYIGRGGTWATHVAPVLHWSERAGLPIVLIVPLFAAPDFEDPTPAVVAQYVAFARRPSVIAVVGFTFRDRPALQMLGLESLPHIREAFEREIGARP